MLRSSVAFCQPCACREPQHAAHDHGLTDGPVRIARCAGTAADTRYTSAISPQPPARSYVVLRPSGWVLASPACHEVRLFRSLLL
jgi:hypothetical protein